jgi:hypothetical protein
MSATIQSNTGTSVINPTKRLDLLGLIRQSRQTVSSGLADEEFTFFLLKKKLPTEAGFEFLCFHDGCVSLTVPPQDDRCWHPSTGWVSAVKEKLAEAFARKHRLTVSEPPDSSLLFLLPDGAKLNHHLRFSDRRETVVIAHPEYLKIRLYSSDKNLMLPLAQDLLSDLAALYRND